MALRATVVSYTSDGVSQLNMCCHEGKLHCLFQDTIAIYRRSENVSHMPRVPREA